MVSDQKCTTRSAIATLLDPFSNRRNFIALQFRFWCFVSVAGLLIVAELETPLCHVTKTRPSITNKQTNKREINFIKCPLTVTASQRSKHSVPVAQGYRSIHRSP